MKIEENNNNKVYFTTDILIFSVSDIESDDLRKSSEKKFSILLVKRQKEPFCNTWCIPGGYVYNGETLEDATNRILEKETKLKRIYKEQLYTFDALDRDPRGRTISTAYIALLDKNLIKDNLDSDAKWFDINYTEKKDEMIINFSEGSINSFALNFKRQNFEKTTNRSNYTLINESLELAFDHANIILEGILRLINKVNYTDIVFNMMPKYFTLGELQRVYESILGKKLLDPAFRRIIADKVTKTKQYIKTGGHRPSVLYKYKTK